MNYFELFEIPVQLKVDIAPLQKKFVELSRKYHPDYFVNDEASVQSEVLEKSALLNKAWKAFKNPDETIKYVLQQKGLLEEEEKYELPPDFLMEVLELNEQLMDADEPAVRDSVKVAIENIQSEIYEPVEKIITNYQEAATSEEELLQVKEYYYKKKYLDRMRRELAQKT
jgi:molecular chaperone HscB